MNLITYAGVEAISSALNAPNSERILTSDSVRRYSIDSFIYHFQQIVTNLTTRRIKV
jgi:hypothetical protein